MLSDAKIVLAERLVALVNRVKARLDIDLARAGVVGGEFGAGALGGISLTTAGLENAFVVPGRNPISQMNEGLRQALPAEPSPQPPTKSECGHFMTIQHLSDPAALQNVGWLLLSRLLSNYILHRLRHLLPPSINARDCQDRCIQLKKTWMLTQMPTPTWNLLVATRR